MTFVFVCLFNPSGFHIRLVHSFSLRFSAHTLNKWIHIKFFWTSISLKFSLTPSLCLTPSLIHLSILGTPHLILRLHFSIKSRLILSFILMHQVSAPNVTDGTLTLSYSWFFTPKSTLLTSNIILLALLFLPKTTFLWRSFVRVQHALCRWWNFLF